MAGQAIAAVLGILLALALLEPVAADGLKFTTHDLRSEKAVRQLYERWCNHFKVARKQEEKVHRFTYFNQTVHRVASRTVRVADEPLRLNGFADATWAEREAMRCCMTSEGRRNSALVPVKRHTRTYQDIPGHARTYRNSALLTLPVRVEWHTRTCQGQPCVGPVRNQWSCGSSWAFAATAAIESHLAIRPGASMIVQLSQQELVDCDHTSHGCKGGLAINAFNYVRQNGIASWQNYPYYRFQQENGTCLARTTPRVTMTMIGWSQLEPHNEYELLAQVTYAPVVVAISIGANNTDFRGYAGGMYWGKCGTKNDHELLLVGYDPDSYILKNSWGQSWGDFGYLFLPRTHNCGILERGGSYPVMGWD
uniref:Ervatamin-C-like protein n=4 Tax=Hordeum TaxID=4512 RepID=A0A881VHW6_9POAL|nr:Ervatamin-C-like protein [Hordeum pubiflorum]QQG62856.1 Ervatamin-C-like protein [Hordeum pubiflorum]